MASAMNHLQAAVGDRLEHRKDVVLRAGAARPGQIWVDYEADLTADEELAGSSRAHTEFTGASQSTVPQPSPVLPTAVIYLNGGI